MRRRGPWTRIIASVSGDCPVRQLMAGCGDSRWGRAGIVQVGMFRFQSRYVQIPKRHAAACLAFGIIWLIPLRCSIFDYFPVAGPGLLDRDRCGAGPSRASGSSSIGEGVLRRRGGRRGYGGGTADRGSARSSRQSRRAWGGGRPGSGRWYSEGTGVRACGAMWPGRERRRPVILPRGLRRASWVGSVVLARAVGSPGLTALPTEMTPAPVSRCGRRGAHGVRV